MTVLKVCLVAYMSSCREMSDVQRFNLLMKFKREIEVSSIVNKRKRNTRKIYLNVNDK